MKTQSTFHRLLPRWVQRLRDWWLMRQIDKACGEARRAVSAMSREERRELERQAHAIMFPEGHWTCLCTHPFGLLVAKGKSCHLCGQTEQPLNAQRSGE